MSFLVARNMLKPASSSWSLPLRFNRASYMIPNVVVHRNFVSKRSLNTESNLPKPSINVELLGIKDTKNVSQVVLLNEISKATFKSWINETKSYSQALESHKDVDQAFTRVEQQFEDFGIKQHFDKDVVVEHFILRYFLRQDGLSKNNETNVNSLKYSDPFVQRLTEKFHADKWIEIEQENKELADAWSNVLSNWATTSKVSNEVLGEELLIENAILRSATDKIVQKIDSEFDNHVSDDFSILLDHVKNSSSSGKSENKKNSGNKDDKTKIKTVEINADSLAKSSLLIAVILFTGYFLTNYINERNDQLSFQDFTSKFLAKGLVQRLTVVNNTTVFLELNENGKSLFPGPHNYYFNIGNIDSFERSLRQVQNELGISESNRLPVLYITEGSTAKMLINFLPTVLFLGAIYYMTKKAGASMGGPLGFGKSTAKKFNEEAEVKVRFKDVAGMTEAKEEVMEFVKFLKNPEKYERLGARIPRGAILSGPPGTGKTLLAKATAGEAGVPFYSVSGSEFIEMFVGVGASRVRDLFKTARMNAPSIVFVDEIDAIGKQRAKGNASGANDERETTLNQLLVEMDGFDTDDHVVVLAGTNRADILDKALMRPGRFDRHISIDNPELLDRKEIFKVHLSKIRLQKDIDDDLPGRLAALTPGFSGADIANVCNEAALTGARFNADSVTLRHFELAIERVIGGVEKKSKLLNPEEQRIVAYHEAGHAICGWYLKYASPLLKVSIIPRGQGALGYAQYLPADRYLESTLQLHDRMVMTLGGRVSEELNFNSVTSGAHDDFKKVTQVAQNMVMRFGMSPKVGMINYADSRDSDDLTKPFSEETNEVIDLEVQRIVKECYDECKKLLTEKAEQVKLVAEELMKKEFITREDMIRLLGKRPYPEQNDAFDKYLDNKPAFKNVQPDEEYKDRD